MEHLRIFLADAVKIILPCGHLNAAVSSALPDVYKRQILVRGIAVESDVSTAIWTCMGYTVLLCFTLFKTSSLARSIFHAH